MLKIAGTPEPKARSWRSRPAVLASAVLVMPLAAIGLYLLLGQPGLPGHPYSPMATRSLAPNDPQSAEITKLVAQLQQRMAEHPQDPVGWRLLGHAQGDLGRWPDSAASYARAVAAGAHDAATLAEWGEALVFANGGTVSPPAQEVFRRAPGPIRRSRERATTRVLRNCRAAMRRSGFTVARAGGAAPGGRALDCLHPGSHSPGRANGRALRAERTGCCRGLTDVPGRARGGDPSHGRSPGKPAGTRARRSRGLAEAGPRLRCAERACPQPRRLGAGRRPRPGRADLQLALAQAEAANGDRSKAAQRLTALLGGLTKNAPERAAVESELNRLRVQQ